MKSATGSVQGHGCQLQTGKVDPVKLEHSQCENTIALPNIMMPLFMGRYEKCQSFQDLFINGSRKEKTKQTNRILDFPTIESKRTLHGVITAALERMKAW